MHVQIRSLDFGYVTSTGDEWIFRDFNLDVQSRSLHSIVGPSGCGKSTLLRLLGGLETPVRGTIDLVGTPLAAQRVALVFQDPTLLPW